MLSSSFLKHIQDPITSYHLHLDHPISNHHDLQSGLLKYQPNWCSCFHSSVPILNASTKQAMSILSLNHQQIMSFHYLKISELSLSLKFILADASATCLTLPALLLLHSLHSAFFEQVEYDLVEPTTYNDLAQTYTWTMTSF